VLVEESVLVLAQVHNKFECSRLDWAKVCATSPFFLFDLA
jgi:hypothetical protein